MKKDKDQIPEEDAHSPGKEEIQEEVIETVTEKKTEKERDINNKVIDKDMTKTMTTADMMRILKWSIIPMLKMWMKSI